MRKSIGFTGLVAVFVLALTALPASAGSPAATLATGSFTLHASQFGGPNGDNRTEAFTVQQSSDGTVRGQLSSRSFSGNISHGNITCFIQEGNQAIVGGVYTAFSQDPTVVGTNFAFAIQDNPDVATFVYFGFDNPGDNPCEDLIPASGFDNLADFLNPDTGVGGFITQGNIKIGP
jgi:hypothetical protein